MTEPAALLEVIGVHAGYRSATVLHDVSFTLAHRGVIAILGPNGAGKTTLLRTISGLIRPTAGRIVLEGTNLVGLPPYQVARRGIAHAPEGRQLFPYLSTEVNLRIGAYARRDRGEVETEIAEHLERFEVIGRRRHSAAGLLSGGEQQLVSILRAVMSKPKVLMLDEPSLGLAPALVKRIYEVVRALVAERHLSVVLVEQAVGQALEIADHIYVLSAGRVLLDSPSADLTPGDIASLYFHSDRSGG